MKALHLVILASLAALPACGKDGTPVGDDGLDEGPLEPLPPEGGQQLATSTITLAPGEEKYMCYQFYSPDNAVGITKIDTLAQEGVHHMAIFQAFGRYEPEEPHECDVLIKQTWLPIYASGTGSPSLTLPTGAAFVIQPGTQYIVQLHLQNASDDPLPVRAGVNFTYDHDPSALLPAGMYAFGSFDMEVPANATNHQVPVSDCATGREMDVFAVFPHMHKYGTSLTMERTPMGGETSMFYSIDPWRFGDQPMDPLVAHVASTDRFDLTCNYSNSTGQAIPYGESSEQEMCFFVMFYTPFTGLAGCFDN